MSPTPKPLAIVPAYVTTEEDVGLLTDAVRSMRATEGDKLDILVVDDGSPNEALVSAFAKLADLHGFDLHRKEENSGFARTVNVGLQRALDEGRDAILVNADVEFDRPWLDAFVATERLVNPGPADVAGGLLIYPQNGLIQHGGVHFSLLTRQFWHTWQHAPQNLAEAHVPRLCPVTAALQLIRHSTLETIGLYDEAFKMGWEDVDYCIRVFLANGECIYNPLVQAFHAESVFRGRPNPKLAAWQRESFVTLMRKYQKQSFAGLVPTEF